MFTKKTESDIQALSPHLNIRRSKRARRIALRMDSAGRKMNLVIPERFSLDKAYDFARQHQDWITDKIEALPETIPFTEGSIIPVLGKEREIILPGTLTFFDPDCDKNSKTGKKKVSVPGLTDTAILIPPGRASIETRTKRFLKKEARQTLSALAHEKAAGIDKTIKSIQIRDTKTRWGSCGPDGQISFSWRLIFAPWETLDYVVAHEVAHLRHMNHSKDFWGLCEDLSTDYTVGKKWIKAQGHSLLRYGIQ